jgi:putative flippase GtrA
MVIKKMIKLYKKYEEIINYLIIGGLTTIVSLVSYYIFTHTFLDTSDLGIQISNVLSWICAVSFAYITNRKFVFKSKNKNILKEISSFFSSRVLTLLMEMLTMFVMVTLLNINDLISKLIAQFIVTVSNYIFSKLFVFKRK